MKLIPIKRFCFDGNIKYYGTNVDVLIPEEYIEKDEELRGVWFSTVANIDIPRIVDVQSYKEYLLSVISKVKEYHMNTVIFQVRPTNDAFYPSELAPWSKFITGVQGQDPGFDVFGFFVEEALKEGIQTHAWINPYRVSGDKLDEKKMTKEEYLETLAENNFARLNPDCVIETSIHKLILDPFSEKVREYVSDVVIEIVTKYPVKAIHIDDYFYPYEPIIDPLEEEKIKTTKFTKVSDFRRNNVDLFIELTYNKLKKLPRKVEFGISPFAILRTNSKYFDNIEDEAAWERGSNNHPSCFSCYKGLYADVYKWMCKGWIDYVVPQDYFDFDNVTLTEDKKEKCMVKYADIAKWWDDICEETKTKLYIGQAIYRYSNDGSWANKEEIPNQLKFNQTLKNVSGTVFFTYKNFIEEHIPSCVEGKKILKTLWTKEVKDI